MKTKQTMKTFLILLAIVLIGNLGGLWLIGAI